jgi:hypothetical protein
MQDFFIAWVGLGWNDFFFSRVPRMTSDLGYKITKYFFSQMPSQL